MSLKEKENHLIDILKDTPSAVIAFSGGVDSSYLAYTAHKVLGDVVKAVMVHSPFTPSDDLEAGRKFCKDFAVPLEIITVNILVNATVRSNPVDRCYYCKHAIMNELLGLVKEGGYASLFEGSLADDSDDYRPGSRAIDELAIRSPLKEAGLTKEDVRMLAKEAALPVWDRPSNSCLATRIPYDEEITSEALAMIDRAELYLKGMGFLPVRVRSHGDTARIELDENGFDLMMQKDMRLKVSEELKKIGFTFVSLDLEGYNRGSMNRVIITEEQNNE